MAIILPHNFQPFSRISPLLLLLLLLMLLLVLRWLGQAEIESDKGILCGHSKMNVVTGSDETIPAALRTSGGDRLREYHESLCLPRLGHIPVKP